MSDPRSAKAAQYRQWYQSRQWRALRTAQFRREPHCGFCRAMGRATLATIVDHTRPHRGDPRLCHEVDTGWVMRVTARKV